MPWAPTATAREPWAKPAAKTGWLEGETAATVSPPSSVRISEPPPAVVKRHVLGPVQAIDCRLFGLPETLTWRGVQVAPPSAVRNSAPLSPTA